MVPAVVLLTGSTGNLGSYLLSRLVRNDRVDRIYCLNQISRSGASLTWRQKQAFEDLGLDIDILMSPKVVLLEGDASQDKLELEDQVYSQIHSSVSVIIHNAWRLDFNLTLPSFEPLLSMTHNLVKTTLSMKHAQDLRFLFTSSISAVKSWQPSLVQVHEDLKIESRYAVGMGCGERKYVAERIIEKSRLQSTSFRIGQLVHSSWVISDWFPILVRSGIQMGSLSTMSGVVSWIPTQTVSDTIVDAMFAQQPLSLALHLVHPRPILWNQVIELAHKAIHREYPERELTLVSASEWLEELEKFALSADKEMIHPLLYKPAVKLLEFFSRMFHAHVLDTGEAGSGPGFACDRMGQISPSSGNSQSLRDRDVESWISYWVSKCL